MKVLIVGSGGREHALAWKIARSDMVTEVIAAPGNVGIDGEPKCRSISVDAEDCSGIKEAALKEAVDLVVVGPEAPLTMGLTDMLEEAGLAVFGPSAQGAQLEGSKVFAKELMKKYAIPTAAFEVFDDYLSASAYVTRLDGPCVVKADGLAAGKGVLVCSGKTDALQALDGIMNKRIFGSAGDRVLVEECLEGEEASFIAFTDGKTVLPLAGSQDHKPVHDGDEGPNTGGMGAYSPAPVITPDIHDRIMDNVMLPTVRAMEQEGIPYKGFLYAGLMITDGAVRVLEFNCRMGDPEAQPLVFRMKSDPVPVMLAAVEGTLESCSIEWEPDVAVCVVMASGGYPGAYEKGLEIRGIAEAEQPGNVKVFHAGTGLESGRLVTRGGRVVGVTARAPGIAPAIDCVYQAVGKISWKDVHYRTDIGSKALNR